MLKQSREPVPRGRKDLDQDELFQLHETSTLLIQKDNLDTLYGRILDAAMSLMSSDVASVQLFDPKRSQLRLLAWKGFHPQSAVFWEWVSFDSASVCGLALSAGCRVVVQDVEASESIAGTPDLDEIRRSNIRAVQSTPLVSRSGHLLGMISTLWRKPHQPTERAGAVKHRPRVFSLNAGVPDRHHKDRVYAVPSQFGLYLSVTIGPCWWKDVERILRARRVVLLLAEYWIGDLRLTGRAPLLEQPLAEPDAVAVAYRHNLACR